MGLPDSCLSPSPPACSLSSPAPSSGCSNTTSRKMGCQAGGGTSRQPPPTPTAGRAASSFPLLHPFLSSLLPFSSLPHCSFLTPSLPRALFCRMCPSNMFPVSALASCPQPLCPQWVYRWRVCAPCSTLYGSLELCVWVCGSAGTWV